MSDLERDISQLRHMGFEEAECRDALDALCLFQDNDRNRLEKAVSYLLQKEKTTSETPRAIKIVRTDADGQQFSSRDSLANSLSPQVATPRRSILKRSSILGSSEESMCSPCSITSASITGILSPHSSRLSVKSCSRPIPLSMVESDSSVSFGSTRSVKFAFPEKMTVFEYERPEEEVMSATETVGSISSDRISVLDPPTCPPVLQITPQSIYEYYVKCCTVGCFEPIPKLIDQLDGADQVVTSLDLSGREINKKTINPILDLLRIDFGLRELNLTRCGLIESTLIPILQVLLSYTSIVSLNLSGNSGLQSCDLKPMFRFIKKHYPLQVLNLSNIHFKEPDLIALARCLSATRKSEATHPPCLRHLSLNDCNIDGAIDVLASGVKMSQLDSLSIQFNKLGAEHVQALTSMMFPRTTGPNQRKFGIDLGFNFIDLQAFSDCLRKCQNISKLGLRRNELDPSDFPAFCSALALNKHLIYLDLGGNHLFEGKHASNMKPLVEYLSSKPQLIELHLDDTKLNGEGLSFFASALNQISKLEVLHLHNNPLGSTGLQKLFEQIKLHSSLAIVQIIPVLGKQSNERRIQELFTEIVRNKNKSASFYSESQFGSTPQESSIEIPTPIHRSESIHIAWSTFSTASNSNKKPVAEVGSIKTYKTHRESRFASLFKGKFLSRMKEEE